MIKRILGKTGKEVSAVGLGTWNIGNQWGEMDDTTAISIIKALFDNSY
jgi:myo-inositol catabolism protein IolS